MGKINSENLWNNAQAGYAAYSQAMNTSKRATAPIKAKKVNQAESVENLVKYLENRPIAQETGDTFTSTVSGAIPGLAIFEAPRGLGWLKKAKGIMIDGGKVVEASAAGADAVNAVAQMRKLATPVTDSLKSIVKGSGKFTTRVSNYMNSVAEFQKNSQNLTEAMKTFKKAKKAGQTVEEFTKAAEGAAKGAAKTGKIAGAFSKVKSTLGKPFASLAQKFPALGKVGKLFKGSGTAGFAVIGGGIELATEVLPTFKQLGFKAGVKQTAKSAVKVAADVGGWAVGAKAGAAAGAAIGSIFPGVGTAIGAAIGTFLGGFIGSWGAGKIAKAVTGPTEREKAQAQQDKNQTESIMANAKDVETLKQLAYEKVQATVQQNGYIDEESQKALEELEKLNNPFANRKIYA